MPPAVKPAVFAAAIAPFGWLLYAAFFGDLGTDPVETIAQVTGTSALVCLAATLSITPLRRLTGWNWLIRRIWARWITSGNLRSSVGLSHFGQKANRSSA